jgi:hypothetical protein
MTVELAVLDLDLDPISVGFDLRAEGLWVKLPAGEPLTVRYQTKRDGQREAQQRELRIVQGTREKVAARLRRHGYRVLTGKPAPWPERAQP